MKPAIRSLGELKKQGYGTRSIKDEIRANLIELVQKKQSPFLTIIGYEDTVIPDVERALLSRHNILFLGLRGQAKTRMAREIVTLLDEWIPVVAGSEINDDPLAPISFYARQLVEEKKDETPIEWVHRSERYGEKLATPDVSVADLIGDIDPIKAANMRLSFADEQGAALWHYTEIAQGSIFVINELPDLQARIQVSLFNILQEGDIQIRGFKLRLPLDILFVGLPPTRKIRLYKQGQHCNAPERQDRKPDHYPLPQDSRDIENHYRAGGACAAGAVANSGGA